jgi:hypothetical protein
VIEHGERMRLAVVRPHHDGLQLRRAPAVRPRDIGRNLQRIQPDTLGAGRSEPQRQPDRERQHKSGKSNAFGRA